MKKLVLAFMMTGSLVATYSQAQKREIKSRDDKKSERREKINKQIRQEEEGEVVFNKQSVWGVKMITDGYGFSYEYGRYKNNRVTTLYQFEFNEKRHNKEKKLSLFDGFGFSNIVLGKMNNFYQTKLGIAQQYRIGGKGNRNGVSVAGILGGGLSIGLMKPYYVNVTNNRKEFKSTFPTIVDSNYAIIGAAGFFSGWKEVKINPGIHTKAALRFDYGRFNESVSALEVGLAAEFFTKKVPQLSYVPQKQFFFTAYISFLFGKRK